jgi:hypothetical protein
MALRIADSYRQLHVGRQCRNTRRSCVLQPCSQSRRPVPPSNVGHADLKSCAGQKAGRASTVLRLPPGIPELSVPPMEPLVIPRLAMENGNGAVRVRAAFNNMTIRGGSNYTITWIKYVCTCQSAQPLHPTSRHPSQVLTTCFPFHGDYTFPIYLM